jgi:protein-disulfide isomerase
MIRRLAVLAAFLLSLAGPALAQQSAMPHGPGTFTEAQRREIVDIIRDALRNDPSILRDAITALQADENDREQGAARAAIAASTDALTRTPGDPTDGNLNGDVTIVEFYDVRCPYCRRMLPVFAELLKRERNVRVVYKDIPILGPGSVVGARAVLAAQRQGGYLKLREALMTGPAQVDSDVVKAAAQRLGLDWDRLQRDMADPAIQTRIDANLKLAHTLNIQGTPAYVIGDQLLPGAVSLPDLQAIIAQARRR